MKKILESFCAECAVLAASRGARSIFIVGILFYSLLYPSPYFYEVPQDLPFFAVDQDGSTSSRQLLRSLEGAGVERLTYVVMTHPHADHAGGMAAVLEAFPTDTLIPMTSCMFFCISLQISLVLRF